MNITGKWALSVFGFISIAFLPFPFLIFFIGKRSRTSSRFFDHQNHSPMHMSMKLASTDHSQSPMEDGFGNNSGSMHTPA